MSSNTAEFHLESIWDLQVLALTGSGLKARIYRFARKGPDATNCTKNIERMVHGT